MLIPFVLFPPPRRSQPGVKQTGNSAKSHNYLCELCYWGELIYFLPALLPTDSSTFPYKLSLQLLSAEFAVVHANRPRKLRSETERGSRKDTLDPVTPAGELCDSKPMGMQLNFCYRC